jgi:hypothetical protein
MIFGNPHEFAIEAYHEPSGPRWAGCGRMCIHVAGATIGNIRDNHCSLYHATDRFRTLSRTVDNLWIDLFAGLEDLEVFGLIDRALYVGDDGYDYPNLTEFDFLTNTGEMFNGTKTFLFTPRNHQVHVLCRFRDDSFRAGLCPVESFRRASNEFVCWFDEQVRTVGPPYFPINPFNLSETVLDSGG